MNQPWALERRIPVAIIVTIFLQTVTVAWWASALTQRVANLEVISSDSRERAERLIRVETQLATALESLRRIEWRVDPRPPTVVPRR